MIKGNTMKLIHVFCNKLTKCIIKTGRKTGISLIILSVMIMIPPDSKGQPSLTLSQAIKRALVNNKTILAAKLDVTISNLQTKALYQKYLPQLSAEYQYLYNPILQTSILPIGVFNPSYPLDAIKSVQFGTKWTQSAGLTATFPLVDLSTQKHIHEAKLQERISAASQEQSEYELAYSVAQTYIDIYLEESKIKSLTADTNRTYISYILLKTKFDEKRLLKSDLNKSKINHNNTVQQLFDALAQLIQDRVNMLYLIGTIEIEKFDFAIDSAFSIKYLFENTDNKIIAEQLPDLQHYQLLSELNNLQAKSERVKRLPTIGLKGYLGANQFANTFNPAAANSWFGLSYFGLNIKVPILFGENPHTKIQQLKLKSNQYHLQKEDKTLHHIKDVFTTKLKIENVQSQLKVQKENITLSSECIGIFQSRVKEGQESALNLNLEEVSIQLLKANYETKQKQLWVYWLDYLKASGQLAILWE